MLRVDLHTHSIAGGHGTLDRLSDMAAEAAKRGLSLLGISDHGPATPGGATLSYFRGLKLLPRSSGALLLRYGAEANIIDEDGHLDLPDDVLGKLDYVIAAIHPGIFRFNREEEVMRAYLGAMKNPFVTFIAHPDDARFPVHYSLFVQRCLEYRCVPELNEVSLSPLSYRKGGRKNAVKLLTQCRRQHCPILLSSDSHGREGIGLVPHASALLAELSFPEELVLNNRLV